MSKKKLAAKIRDSFAGMPFYFAMSVFLIASACVARLLPWISTRMENRIETAAGADLIVQLLGWSVLNILLMPLFILAAGLAVKRLHDLLYDPTKEKR